MRLAHSRTWRHSVALAIAAVVAIATPAYSSPAEETSAPTNTGSPPSVSPPTYRVEATNVVYQKDRNGNRHVLTVYAPTAHRRPWPTAVMIHGAGNTRLNDWARNTAREGIVVFVPYWKDVSDKFTSPQRFRRLVGRVARQLACAVQFSRATTRRYGGDPRYLSLFGFSAGANYASMITFAGTNPASGCLAKSGSTAPSNVVLFDGDWLLVAADWYNPFLRKDPGLMRFYAPWAHLATARRLPVHILDSGDPGLTTRNFGYGPARTWLPLRDPTGELQRGLRHLRAFKDGDVSETEIQLLLRDQLRKHGYQVSFRGIPNGRHNPDVLDPKPKLQIAIDAMLADRPGSHCPR